MSKKSIEAHDVSYWTAERKLLALEAAWELEALGSLLPSLVPRSRDSIEPALQVRGIAARLRTLASALMTAIDDEVVTTEEIKATLGLHLEV